jgi:DNA adenine methylase
MIYKSPLRYPGGKSRGVQFLNEFTPSFNEFREPFFGGGSFCFYLVQKRKNKTYKASDLNYELFCFWTQLQKNKSELISGVQHIYDTYQSLKNGKQLFYELVERRQSNLSELQRAIDFYVLNRITFSGVVDSGGYSQGSFEGRFTQSSIDRLHKTSELIQHINFYCEDYSYLLQKDGENVFIFLDPPYYSATKSKLYGKKGILHTEFDHNKLFDTLNKTNHKWMITYDNSDYIKDLYKNYFQFQWQLSYGMTTKYASGGKNEILIANYDLLAQKNENSISNKALKLNF